MRTTHENIFDAIIGNGWANDQNGHVEAPTGHFALVDMVDDRAMLADVADVTEDDLPEPGWYIVRTDQLGFIHVHRYPTGWVARRDFEILEGDYAEWDDVDQF